MGLTLRVPLGYLHSLFTWKEHVHRMYTVIAIAWALSPVLVPTQVLFAAAHTSPIFTPLIKGTSDIFLEIFSPFSLAKRYSILAIMPCHWCGRADKVLIIARAPLALGLLYISQWPKHHLKKTSSGHPISWGSLHLTGKNGRKKDHFRWPLVSTVCKMSRSTPEVLHYVPLGCWR